MTRAAETCSETSLLVLGADTPVGALVVSEALWREYKVTAVVSGGGSVPHACGLSVLEVDPVLRRSTVCDAFRGHGAVLIPPTEETNRQHFVWTTAAGLQFVQQGLAKHRIPRCVIALQCPGGTDRRRTESAMIGIAGLDWTVGYLGTLTDGPAAGLWTASDTFAPPASICRAHVAEFFLDAVDYGLGLCQSLVVEGASRSAPTKSGPSAGSLN